MEKCFPISALGKKVLTPPRCQEEQLLAQCRPLGPFSLESSSWPHRAPSHHMNGLICHCQPFMQELCTLQMLLAALTAQLSSSHTVTPPPPRIPIHLLLQTSAKT